MTATPRSLDLGCGGKRRPGFIGLDRYADLEALLASLRAEGIAIDELALQETDLEQVFLRIMAGEAAARAGARAADARVPGAAVQP